MNRVAKKKVVRRPITPSWFYKQWCSWASVTLGCEEKPQLFGAIPYRTAQLKLSRKVRHELKESVKDRRPFLSFESSKTVGSVACVFMSGNKDNEFWLDFLAQLIYASVCEKCYLNQPIDVTHFHQKVRALYDGEWYDAHIIGTSPIDVNYSFVRWNDNTFSVCNKTAIQYFCRCFIRNLHIGFPPVTDVKLYGIETLMPETIYFD
jgi:hypothetical protein